MKFYFSILLIIIYINAFPQNCIDTSLKVNYHALGYKLAVKQNLIDVNSLNVLLGNYSNPNDTGYYFIRLNPENTINFSKKIIFNPLPNIGFGCLIKSLKNGNYITAYSNIISNFAAADTSVKLILFDNNGNVIWAKKYARVAGRLNATYIDETNNGDIIFLLKLQNGLDDTEPARFGSMKINQAGVVIWSKQFDAINMGVSDLKAESFSVINNNIYIKGFFEKTFDPIPSVYDHRWFASKINSVDGTLIDSKSFTDLRYDDKPEQSLILANYANQISTTKNDLLFTNFFKNETNTKRGTTKIVLDTNLNFTNAIFYSYSNASYINNRILGNKNKDVFIYGNTESNNVLNASYFAKIDSNNAVQRELFVNYPVGATYKPIGEKPLGLKNKYLNVLNSYNQNGDNYLELAQFADNVPITACYGKDTSIVKIEPYIITEVLHPFLNEFVDITDIVVTNLPVSITPLPLVSEKQCTIISDCNIVKINPTPDSICNLNNEVQFTAHVNGACLKKVLWQLDTSAYSYILAVNDSTVAIKFKKTWQGYLYAVINTCNNLKDSVYLNVFNTPTILNIGNDTTLCAGASLTLKAGIGFASYQWQNGTSNDSLVVTNTGVYNIIAKDACGNIFKDTVTVKYFLQPALINLGNDTTLCVNNNYTLRAGTGYKNYLWQDGSTTDSFKISQPGKYFLQAIDSCNNIFRDTINVEYYILRLPVNLGADIIFCQAKTYILTGGKNYKNYTWQDGSINENFTATQAGIYYLTVTDSCGNKSSDTLIIKPEINYQLKIDFINAICIFDTATIILPNTFSNYKIFPINNNNIYNNILKLYPNQNTLYNIEAWTPFGCKIRDTLLVKIKNCSDIIYFPNAFTPNRDNNNDYFKPSSEAAPIIYELIIYNRYGQKIFETKNIQNGWDGKVKSVLQNTGSFVWTCKYQFRNKPIINKSGSFILLR